jgi:hypothetical protein
MNTRRPAIIAVFCLLFVVQVSLLAFAAQKSNADSTRIFAVLMMTSGVVDAIICYGTLWTRP